MHGWRSEELARTWANDNREQWGLETPRLAHECCVRFTATLTAPVRAAGKPVRAQVSTT